MCEQVFSFVISLLYVVHPISFESRLVDCTVSTFQYVAVFHCLDTANSRQKSIGMRCFHTVLSIDVIHENSSAVNGARKLKSHRRANWFISYSRFISAGYFLGEMWLCVDHTPGKRCVCVLLFSSSSSPLYIHCLADCTRRINRDYNFDNSVNSLDFFPFRFLTCLRISCHFTLQLIIQ